MGASGVRDIACQCGHGRPPDSATVPALLCRPHYSYNYPGWAMPNSTEGVHHHGFVSGAGQFPIGLAFDQELPRPASVCLFQ